MSTPRSSIRLPPKHLPVRESLPSSEESSAGASYSSVQEHLSAESSYGDQSTERQFPELGTMRAGEEQDSAEGSSQEEVVVRGARDIEDVVTRSILDDISDHDLLYSSVRKPSRALRVGISLLPDFDLPTPLPPDSPTYNGLCSQFSAELKTTKGELSKLYLENKQLYAQIQAQERHIWTLNALYRDQTAYLKQELDDLRRAVRSKERLSDDLQTKPTIETEENLPVNEVKDACCRLF